MAPRKRDDLEEGALYRVTARLEGTDDDWVHTSYGHYGAPRTYMTAGAAKGMKTRMERSNSEVRHYQRRLPIYEFRVERAPVTNWEPIDG
jgi:hypothetical protein